MSSESSSESDAAPKPLGSRAVGELSAILRRLQESSGTTLVVVTHDRRFITPDDLVLEIQDGQLANGHEAGAVDYAPALSAR
jgi:putative ABC transport system ATP-binding protein